MDTKFSSAIHTLILIAGAEKPKTSKQLAQSVGTNASYIRKLTALMKKAGIIESRRGAGGFSLSVPADKISLLQIYRGVSQTENLRIFDIHQNPNDICVVGRYIQPTLKDMFRITEQETENRLANMSLQDCIDNMKSIIENSGENIPYCNKNSKYPHCNIDIKFKERK